MTAGNSSTNCVYMRTDGQWSFDSCSTTRSFVCELPETTCKQFDEFSNHKKNLDAPCYGFLQGNQQCFMPSYALDYFADAEQKCKSSCSDLAYISNKAVGYFSWKNKYSRKMTESRLDCVGNAITSSLSQRLDYIWMAVATYGPMERPSIHKQTIPTSVCCQVRSKPNQLFSVCQSILGKLHWNSSVWHHGFGKTS